MTFTYETKDKLTPLETYEWENVWWDHPEDKETPRAVYIGDSISCGIRSVFQPESKGIRLDGFGTSKAVDHQWFQKTLHLFAMQSPKPKAVLFNNGLHGWHLDDAAFADNYGDMVKFLLIEYPCVPLVLVTSTYVEDERREALVRRRNAIMEQVARKHNLILGDLYQVSKQYRSLLSSDGVHFTKEGYERLADALWGYLQLGFSQRLKV